LLRDLGFDWSALGEGTYAVRAIPALLADARATQLFEAALTSLEGDGEDRTDAVLRSLANRAAKPNGDPLDDAAAERIVAGVWPRRDAHRSCVIGRVQVSLGSGESFDD
jgi:DNA mismatch repair ATPase MutL